MRASWFGYTLGMSLAAAAALGILSRGVELPVSPQEVARTAVPLPPSGRSGDPLAAFLLQVVVVAAAARLSGAAARRLGQPAVVGEIAAGIVLGPSVLGAMAPALYAGLFPAGSLEALRLISQLGIVVFMFLVGLELDADALDRRSHAAVVVSHAGIVVPFVLGLALALGLFSRWAPPGVGFLPFALFLGVAMSVTAFPVLARIIADRGLTRTPLGTLALACAAVDDVTAWCLLAGVVAVASAGSARASALTIASVAAFSAVMFLGVRPVLARAARALPATDTGLHVGLLALAFLSGLCTELIGIHALFGAFLAGVIVPQSPGLRAYLRERLGGFATLFLLPLFFVFSGLRTRVGLLAGPEAWEACGMILLVAVTGKFAGSALAARLVGSSWPEAVSVGALMNTRGLMELVALNVGYDLGVVSEPLFAMMVLMALVTTAMAGPVLRRVERWAPGTLVPAPLSGNVS